MSSEKNLEASGNHRAVVTDHAEDVQGPLDEEEKRFTWQSIAAILVRPACLSLFSGLQADCVALSLL